MRSMRTAHAGMSQRTMEPEELKEVFGEVISSYTDADGIRDGVLVDVKHIAPPPINIVTRAVWEAYVQPIGKLGPSPVINVTGLAQKLRAMRTKMENGQLQEGLIVLEDGDRTLWAMPNETGWTVMFPEDY